MNQNCGLVADAGPNLRDVALLGQTNRDTANRDRGRAEALPLSKRAGFHNGTGLLVSLQLKLCALGLCGLFSLVGCEKQPPPQIVVPTTLATLDPLLQETIRAEISRAKQDLTSPDSHGTVGMVYEANELWSLALQSYDNARSLSPDSPTWQFRRAVCMIELGSLAEATAILQAMTRRFPNFAPAWHRLGCLQLQAGQVAEAFQSLRSCVKIVPQDPAARASIADCYIRQKEYDQAFQILREVVRANSSFAHAKFLLGLAHRGLGNKEKAIRWMSKGEDAPRWYVEDNAGRNLPRYRAGLSLMIEQGLSLLEAGRAAEALTVLERARQHHPKEVSLLNNVASALQALKRSDEALQVLDLALREEPQNFRTYLNRSVILLANNQLQESFRAAEEAVALAPQASESHMALTRCLMLLQRFPQAEAAARRVLELNSESFDALVAIAEVELRRQDYPAAKISFGKLLERFPDGLPYMVNLGIIHLQLGELAEAEAMLEAAQKINPNHGRVLRLAERIAAAKK